jgi:hypothetical protein
VTSDIVLWLDLAEANQMEDAALREHLPPGAPILRLTERGAVPCPSGTPKRWRPVLDAIDRLVRDARVLERERPGCRYWVTGRAGLPAFFHLGHRLSKVAAITFVHQSRNGEAVEVMRLDASSNSTAAPYFSPPPSPIPRTDATTAPALVVSSLRRPSDQQIHDAMAERKTRVGDVIHAHAPAHLDATTIGPALREIEHTVREVCDTHTARSTLAIFIAGPPALAFLAGGAIAPRACRDVQIFELEGSRYTLAYELPYPPVPDRNTVVFFPSSPPGSPELALDQEIRATRLEQCDRTVADRLDFVFVPAAQPGDIRNLLRKRAPGVVHFSGHGETGELAELAELLRLEGGSVRLVVLNACHSESHVPALLAHVDCVVTMRGKIWDVDARRFSAALYMHLAEGDSVQDAFNKAVQAIRLEQPAHARGARMRDVDGVEAWARLENEDPQLRERDPGYATGLYLVRRRR